MTEFQKHETSEECENAALDLFSEAVKDGKWLMAVWRVDGENDILFKRVTCNFPTGAFIQTMNILKESLLEELDQELSIKPLPLAPHLLVRDGNGKERRINPTRVLHEEKEVVNLSTDEQISIEQQKAYDVRERSSMDIVKESKSIESKEHNEEDN